MSDYFEVAENFGIAVTVADAIKTAREEGLGKMPEIVCFDIARHVTFETLTQHQAHEFSWRMKRLISAHRLQKARRS